MKKTSILSIIIFLSVLSTAQSRVDSYKPYLIENETISSASTISMNKDETDLDTINCFIEIIDTASGVKVKSVKTGLTYHVSFWIRAYSLWVVDMVLGDHWDLFDEKYRLLRLIPGITIGKIIEVK